jgi:hypothetical protein
VGVQFIYQILIYHPPQKLHAAASFCCCGPNKYAARIRGQRTRLLQIRARRRHNLMFEHFNDCRVV